MIPTPIRQVLSTIQKHGVQALLMGGQACVFYGAAQFSKDIDFVLLNDHENYRRLQAALSELQAERIAVPRFDPDVLDRGHAVHFRCRAAGVEGLRVDVMTRLRGLPDFVTLWDRRTTIEDADGITFQIMGVSDLVQAKKTQRAKDWPMISALVENHYHSLREQPSSERIEFWLQEMRIPERLIELCKRYSDAAVTVEARRPLLKIVQTGDLDALRAALDAEVRAEQAKDREYWQPLRKELEQFRFEERSHLDNG